MIFHKTRPTMVDRFTLPVLYRFCRLVSVSSVLRTRKLINLTVPLSWGDSKSESQYGYWLVVTDFAVVTEAEAFIKLFGGGVIDPIRDPTVTRRPSRKGAYKFQDFFHRLPTIAPVLVLLVNHQP